MGGCASSSNMSVASKAERSDTIVSSIPARPTPRPTINSRLFLPVVDIFDFLDFCETKHAGENVKFYIALDEYEKLFDKGETESTIIETGEDIVIRFISEKSRNEVSLASEIKNQIMKAFENGSWKRDTFKAARMEVVTTLKHQFIREYEQIWLSKK